MSASTDNNEVPTNNKAPASSNQSQSRKGKKRKRVKQSDKNEQYQKERTDRYNKLHHACTKHFHREAKVVKSFECQKIVRSIKAIKDTLSSGDGEREASSTLKHQKRLETLQQKLDHTKKMELDVLVQVGLKRLGVLSLDPKLDAKDTNDTAVSDSNGHTESPTNKTQDTITSSQSEDLFYQTLLESMFRHKRLSNALDQLNEKVTDYRQWTVRRAQGGNNNNYGDDQLGGKKGKKKKKRQQQSSDPGNDTLVVAGGFNSRKRGLNLGGHEGASGLFIGSLSGMAAEGYDDDEGGDEYGDDYEYPTVEKKKNRPGQRARRAKAMAIEAKNAGKTWDSSINWREKKKDTTDGERSTGGSRGGERREKSNSRDKQNTRNKSNTDNKPKETKHQDIATMGKAWKEEGNAHPSWAAKAAAQKSQGIAEFKGKKITFD